MYDALELGTLKERDTTATERPAVASRLRLRPRRLLGLGLLLLLLPGLVLLGGYCWAQHQLRIGRDLLERYHHDEAKPYLEASLRLRTNHAQTLLLLARAARRAGAMTKADEFLERYQNQHGQTEELIRERIFQTAAKGDVDKVVRYCQRLVADNDPDAVLALEAVVTGYFRLLRINEGRAALQTWLNQFPDNTQALFTQAGVWTLLLHHAKAVPLYERVLELDPEHDKARFNLALVLMEDRLYPAALPHLELLVQRQPNNLAAAVQLARCRDFFGQEAEAVQLLEQVLSREPHFSHALSERGRIAMRQGRGAFAEECLREALAQEPGNHELLYQLTLCLDRNGKVEEAEGLRRRLRQLKTDLNRVEELASTLLPSRPHDVDLQHEFAVLLLKTGKDNEGLEWLHRILQEKPSYLPAHQTLAEFYRQTGAEQQAAYHQQFLGAPRQTPSIASP